MSISFSGKYRYAYKSADTVQAFELLSIFVNVDICKCSSKNHVDAEKQGYMLMIHNHTKTKQNN